MNQKTVYQYDPSGMLLGTTMADASPLEPGVWHMPARTTEVPPPAEFPADKWPRWNGSAWSLATRPQPQAQAADQDPLAKLRAFLEQNPEVAALL